MLVTFVGAIGTLMAETGLAQIWESVFGGVEKILTGKKFPMNVRAMRMVAEELLRDVVDKSQLNGHHHFMNVLENLGSTSRTAKMRVDGSYNQSL